MHNIYREKFYSLRVPAWHDLGLVSDIPVSAVEAGRKLGLPQIYTESLQTVSGLLVPDHKAIIGRDGDKVTVYSVVSEEYKEITHSDFCLAWDQATENTPVETLGLLGKGDTLFLTTKLPGFAIKGVDHENYLLAVNPLTGKQAVYGRVTPVRVVCQNTLNLSSSQFVEEFRAIHVGDQLSSIKRWLENTWQTARAQSETLQEAYALLANKQASLKQAEEVLLAAYPEPEQPVKPPSDDNLKQWAEWEQVRDKQESHRLMTYNLYRGQGLGSSYADVAGTLYGVYNAVCEYEQFGKRHGRSSSAFVGAGAERTGKAFDKALEIAGAKAW